MQNRIEYILFIGFSYLTKLLGLKLSRKFAEAVAYVFYFLIPIRKEVAIQNIKLAFPAYSDKEVRRVALGAYKSFSITIIETLYIPHISKKQMIESVKCVNIDLLRRKVFGKKGVILLTAHFGNWEYLAASIALQLNYQMHLLVKVQRNPYVTEFMNNARTKWNSIVIPLGTAVRQIFKALKDNKVVLMAADQRGNADGLRIEFLGRMSAVYTGPASIALKTGADIFNSDKR